MVVETRKKQSQKVVDGCSGQQTLWNSKVIYLVFVVVITFLSGCQPKVYLMPPPIGIKAGGELFNLSKDNEDDNLLLTLYATNRNPADEKRRDSRYTIFPSDDLRLGFVVHRLGEEKMSWEEIVSLSLQNDRDKDLLIKQEYVREMASYHLQDDLYATTAQANGYFDQINKLLGKSYDKDILIYVHGANSNFYRATAQGAQLYHFTGHNTVVLSFSWPSAESLLKYKTDVAHAKKTIPAFARLIELLATHTNAHRINVLAYSAGAQVAAPGLAYLVDKYPLLSSKQLKKKLRLGEVYFAAPDTALKPFAQRYLKFRDMVERTTVNINTEDSVLRLSEFQNKESRLGRPNRKDLSDEDAKTLIEASKTALFNILDIHSSESLEAQGAHDTWYAHPWVSSDLLMLHLFNAGPLDRGLDEYRYENGTKTYIFPDNYPKKIRQILDEDMEKWRHEMMKEHTKQ